jgi:hypothetical protein
MSPSSDISIAATALRDIFFSVDPCRAALWFLPAHRSRGPAGLCMAPPPAAVIECRQDFAPMRCDGAMAEPVFQTPSKSPKSGRKGGADRWQPTRWQPIGCRCGVPAFHDRRATLTLRCAHLGRSLQPGQMSAVANVVCGLLHAASIARTEAAENGRPARLLSVTGDRGGPLWPQSQMNQA